MHIAGHVCARLSDSRSQALWTMCFFVIARTVEKIMECMGRLPEFPRSPYSSKAKRIYSTIHLPPVQADRFVRNAVRQFRGI